MSSFDLRRFPAPEPLAQSAAQDCLTEVSAVTAEQHFSVALSGGRIAATFFSALAAQAAARKLSLNVVHFFWSDERCVPPDASESNFRLAREFLLDPLRVPENRIHRIHGEKPPAEAAAAAEADLRNSIHVLKDDQPILDLVLLGVGEEGHVASLFPGEPQTVLAGRSVFRPVRAVKPPPQRITLGYPAIAAARQVWVLASGAGKEAALRQSLAPDGSTPLARVLASRSSTRIYSDCRI